MPAKPVRLSPEVHAALKARRRPGQSLDGALRELLGLGPKGATPARPARRGR